MTTIIVLTGAPRVGKTTAIMRLAWVLKERGVKVGGIVSRELRTNNMRRIQDSSSSILAQMTKVCMNMFDFSQSGQKAQKLFLDNSTGLPLVKQTSGVKAG
jgi:nucleoside-triphosphatase THEP1